MQNCNFKGTNFIGRTWMRHCDARRCNFKDAKTCHFYVYIKSENIDIETDGTLEEFYKYFDLYRKAKYNL